MTSTKNITTPLAACAILIGLLVITQSFGDLPVISSIFGLMVIAYQVVVPFWLIGKDHQDLKDYNIQAHGLETIFDAITPPFSFKSLHVDWQGVRKDLMSVLKISALYLVPFALVYLGVYFLGAYLDEPFVQLPKVPQSFFLFVATQIFVIALPEEIFYRGYVQSCLLKRWPNRRFLWGIPCGRAIVLTNLLFAVAHIPHGGPLRLLTFFPGLLFSSLVVKDRSILSAIVFHASCNVAGAIFSTGFNSLN